MCINNWSEKWSSNMQKAHKVMKKSDYIKKLAYNNAYNRQNYKSFSIRLNRESEAFREGVSSSSDTERYGTGSQEEEQEESFVKRLNNIHENFIELRYSINL